MVHPDDAHIMNYILGRETDRDARSHLARCPRCQKRMAELEDSLIEAAKEREAESFNFKIQNHR